LDFPDFFAIAPFLPFAGLGAGLAILTDRVADLGIWHSPYCAMIRTIMPEGPAITKQSPLDSLSGLNFARPREAVADVPLNCALDVVALVSLLPWRARLDRVRKMSGANASKQVRQRSAHALGDRLFQLLPRQLDRHFLRKFALNPGRSD
jgi:hypothetical protein